MIKARYTVVLKDLLDDPACANMIDNALQSYPIYKQKSKEEFIPSVIPTREELNKKILDHYKYREIGFETPARFADELQISMCEIMPKYNQMLFSLDQDFNILFNVDYSRTTKRNLSGSASSASTATSESETSGTDSSTTSGTTSNKNKSAKADTPQSNVTISGVGLSGINYASEVNGSEDSGSTEGTTSGSTTTSGSSTNTGSGSAENSETESTEETTRGNFGVVSSQDLILKYRELILNVEQEIINDPRITELFMLVY